MSISSTTLLEREIRPRVLLVGDVMLDRYVWGDVERISPEAPIPILRIESQEHRLGGAGSVASMLAMLGAETILAAVVGDDDEGRTVAALLDNLEVNHRLVLAVNDRVTTVKQRLLGRAQHRYPHQMMRVDRESVAAISAKSVELLLSGVARCMDEVDLVLVSDYDKGVCKGDLFPRLIELARKAGVPVVADPVKDADYRRYAGCTCITPNRAEAGRALGIRITTPQEGLDAARRLLDFGLQSVIVTLDRDGMAWVDRSGRAKLFPARPRQVCDITGAGDMVLSVLGYMLAAGADTASAIEVANVAGGLEVERLGVVPLSRRDILNELAHGSPAGGKILSIEQLSPMLERLRSAGTRLVMTNGCFDLLHPGHVASLQEARKQGDCLLVAVNSDRSVREIKGPNRPVIDEQGRAEMLAALACVDYVVVFDEASVAGLVERIQPDVLVKADQYTTEQVVGHESVLRRGGHVVAVPTKARYSTSDLIERIQNIPFAQTECRVIFENCFQPWREFISIIICTRDRAESLKETLRAIGECVVPADLAAEVLVVDNGSSDRTRAVVRKAGFWGQAPRYLYEPRPGQCQAQNTGMAAAQGEVLLWTDDDVQPGRNWIEATCRPILTGQADAVAGRIKLPENLERPWLQAWHRVCLAVDAPTTGEFHLTGANMAFARRVLEKVPAFDLELGPGASLGFGAETLFSRQLLRAGFRLLAAGEESTVLHHCGEHRLARGALIDTFMRMGRSQAYIDYHWAHRTAWFPTFRGGKSLLGLVALRLLQRLRGDGDPLIGRLEARWLWRWSYYRQMTLESRRPRRYEQFGLALAHPRGPFAAQRPLRAA